MSLRYMLKWSEKTLGNSIKKTEESKVYAKNIYARFANDQKKKKMSDSNLCDNELSAGFSLLEGMGGVPPLVKNLLISPLPT